MGKTRTISKTCGKCQGLVAVACKSCTNCGYVFATKKGLDSKKKTIPGQCIRTRQSIKPNFYDPNQYEKKKNKKKVYYWNIEILLLNLFSIQF